MKVHYKDNLMFSLFNKNFANTLKYTAIVPEAIIIPLTQIKTKEHSNIRKNKNRTQQEIKFV